MVCFKFLFLFVLFFKLNYSFVLFESVGNASVAGRKERKKKAIMDVVTTRNVWLVMMMRMRMRMK